MSQAGNNGTPQFMSTHPAPGNRTAALEAAIPKVMPLYRQARGGN
jgi:hypothetical protein